jgi:hypothetical protein
MAPGKIRQKTLAIASKRMNWFKLQRPLQTRLLRKPESPRQAAELRCSSSPEQKTEQGRAKRSDSTAFGSPKHRPVWVRAAAQ